MLVTELKEIEEMIEGHERHTSVMEKEVQTYLNLSPDACFVDCTLGLGGHSRLLASTIGPRGHIIGIDRDKESLKVAEQNLSSCSPRRSLVHGDFRNIDSILDRLGVTSINGMLFDLGISSFQLDNPERGFSFKEDGPLDMRIDQDSFVSAYDLINALSEREIALILKNFGEERWHNRIARFLVERRPIQSTKELRETVLRAIPGHQKRQSIHPATRTFQAFRIAVNRELESLEIALEKCIPYLAVGGRICVISFHSLEDRIVKHKFRAFAKAKEVQLVFKKPLRPEAGEVVLNARARSARLRVAEKI